MNKKVSKVLLLVIIVLSISLVFVSCTDDDGIVYENIDTIVVNEASIADGFLLSEFDITKVLLDVKYKDTKDTKGNTVTGETVQLAASLSMVIAEDKAQLSVAGSKTITLTYGKFTISFVLKLYDDTTQKYKVVFLSEDGLSLGDTQYIIAGGKATQPTVPTKTGYDFLGWKDRDTNTFSSFDNITKDTTLVAYYAAKVFSVTYCTRVVNNITATESSEGTVSGATTVDTQLSKVDVPRGANALDYAPEIPVIQGYSNGHWEDTDAMDNVSSEGLKFYAVYDQDTVVITFNYKKYDALSVDDTKNYYVNGIIQDTFDVERDGYKFVGWFNESGKQITFPYTVTNEMRFVAKYIEIETGNEGLSYELINNGTEYAIVGYDGAENVIVIPDLFNGLYVTKITAGIFNNYGIKEFVVSSKNKYFKVDAGVLYNFTKDELLAYPTLKTDTSFSIDRGEYYCLSIADYAFSNAKYLTSVNLGFKLAYIGKEAFKNCTSLLTVTFPASLTEIGVGAFKMTDSSALTSITFTSPSLLTTIDNEAFYGLNNLISIDIPTYVNSIGSGVFQDCKSLTQITVAENNNYFIVFQGGLYDIDITNLYCYPANYSGNNITDLVLPDTLTDIIAGAFSYTKIQGICITANSITLESDSIICPNLIYLRVLSDSFACETQSFGEYIPEHIYVENADVLDYISTKLNLTSGVEQFDNDTDWVELNNFLTDYIYKLETVTVIENNKTVQKTTVTILGRRNSVAALIIPETLNDYDVTKIADYAFCADNVIKSVTLPNALTSIGEYAFANIPTLTTLIMNANINTIGYRAFFGCTKLSRVDFGADVEIASLGIEAFTDTAWYTSESQEYLTINSLLVKYNGYGISATIEATIKNIASDAFSNKTNLTTITFETDILETIGYRAFQFCTGISSITLPSSVKAIESEAFYGCSNLLLVNIDTNITNSGEITINASAFPVNTSIRYTEGDISYTLYYRIDESETKSEVGTIFVEPIEIEDNVNTKFAGWFTSADYTTLVTFPLTLTLTNTTENASVRSMTIFAKFVSASEGSSGLKYELNDNGGYTITDYTGTDRYVIVPQKYKKLNINAIADDAFASGTTITNISLPYGTVASTGVTYSYIKSVGENVFDNTLWYQNYRGDFVIINDILIRYKGSASVVEIPSTIVTIAAGAFYNNTYITSVVIPEGVTTIGNNMFRGCTNLTSVTLPSTITSIGDNAFSGCTKLSNINFETALVLTSISSSALDNTAWINNCSDDCIIINSILYKYQGYVGIGSISDGKLTIMNGITQIADRAFENDESLTKIYIPESMESIGEYAFSGSLITEVIIFSGGSNLIKIDNYAFNGCINLSKINISVCSDLYTIGDYAFGNTPNFYNDSVSALTIPAGVTVLGEGAFKNSNIVNVIFASGSKLKEISKDAFYNCTNLASVIFNGTSALTIIGESSFYNCSSLNIFTNTNAALETIEDRAFYECIALKRITINTAKLTFIGSEALYNMGYVSSYNSTMVVIGSILIKYKGTDSEVEIPYTITTIYDEAFSGNTNLTKITFPQNSKITTINDKAFYNCTNLETINFPSTITTVGDDVVTNTLWYNNLVRDGEEFITIGNTLIKYNGEAENIIIPEAVTKLNANAFNGVTLYNIEIGIQVTDIAAGAFDGIEIPHTTYTIDAADINSTTGSWSLTMNKITPVNIGENTIYKIYVPTAAALEDYLLDSRWSTYENILDVVANYTVTLIIDEVKGDMLDNISVSMIYNEIAVIAKEGYVFIGWYLDSGYTTALHYPLDINADVTIYAKFVSYDLGTGNGFNRDNDVIVSYVDTIDVTIVIPTELANIPLTAITGYWAVKDEANGKYGTHVFNDLTQQYEEAEQSVATHYYIGAFEGHTELEVVYFANNSQITTIGKYAFLNCTSLRKIVLPASITTIEEGAFEGCTSLKEIVFTYNSNVTISIATDAFKGCISLKTITFPANIGSLATDAFAGCTSLINIYMTDIVSGTVCALEGAIPFDNNDGLLRIYVGTSVYIAYKSNWDAYEEYLVEVTE